MIKRLRKIVPWGRYRGCSCEIRTGSSLVAHRHRTFKIRAWIQVFNFLSFKNSRNRWIVENEWAQWINFHTPCIYCLLAFHMASFTCILNFYVHVISHPVFRKLVFKIKINYLSLNVKRKLSSQRIILKLVISGLKLHGFIMTVGRQTNERFPGIFRVTSRESMDEFH